MRVHFEKIVTGGAHSFAVREFCSRVFTSPFHFHPEYELTFVLAGRGRRFVGDSVEEYGPGDLAFLGANLPHRWASTPPSRGQSGSRSLVLQFRRECLGEPFFAMPELAAIDRLLQRAERGLHYTGRITREIGAALAALRQRKGAARIAEFVTILDRLAAAKPRVLASVDYRPRLNAIGAARIDRVITYVEENHGNESLSLAEVAAVASLTPSAFSRFFARSAGRTFVNFLNEVRVSHACQMLMETDEQITSICFACGFGTVSNFNQRFRKLQGQAPREYRQAYQASDSHVPGRFTIKP